MHIHIYKNSPNLKDRVTVLQKSSLIYRFTGKCDICYMGRTNQRFEIRINQVSELILTDTL